MELSSRLCVRVRLVLPRGFDFAVSASDLDPGFPFADIAEDTTFCDVGGGVGSMSLAIVQRFPHLKIVLQDVPEQLASAKKLWAEKAKTVVDTQRIEFIPFDFFKESPKQGCDIYYVSLRFSPWSMPCPDAARQMRMIVHDWADKECLTILENVKRAMSPTSRLLIRMRNSTSCSKTPLTSCIDEYVLQNPLTRDMFHKYVSVAPAPLLPNWGSGRLMPHIADMVVSLQGLMARHILIVLQMMGALNSKERTVEEFLTLGLVLLFARSVRILNLRVPQLRSWAGVREALGSGRDGDHGVQAAQHVTNNPCATMQA